MFMGVYVCVHARARARVCVCSEGETRMFEGSICPMCVRFGVSYRCEGDSAISWSV